MRFYRSKVDLVQTHELTSDTFRAATAYLLVNADAPKTGALLPGSRKNRALSGKKMQGGRQKAPFQTSSETLGEPVTENGMTACAINRRLGMNVAAQRRDSVVSRQPILHTLKNSYLSNTCYCKCLIMIIGVIRRYNLNQLLALPYY